MNNKVWSYVSKNLRVELDYSDLVDNPNVDWVSICADKNLYKRIHYIHHNTAITTDIIVSNKQILNKYLIVANENYPIDEKEFNNVFTSYNNAYLENPNILPRLIELYDRDPSKVVEISSGYISMMSLSLNTGLTWEMINHLKLNWNFSYLSRNRIITWEIVQANKHLPWDYRSMSANINITWEIVKSHPELNWSFDFLTSNPNITWEIIQANPDKPWSLDRFLENPNLTSRVLIQHKDKFKSLETVALNHFNRHVYFTLPVYKSKLAKLMHDKIYTELISRACTPVRTYQWNETACEEFPEEYIRECLRWK
jgi:hypothetical protein